MSLRCQTVSPVPDETARVAKAVFSKGNAYLSMRDKLGTIYTDELFADLFARRGQPAEAPWRLALVTVFQFAENLTDRQAADAVRSRIDWKYALGLELTDPGFHYSVLSEFRGRLLAGNAERRLLEAMLSQLKAHGLLRSGGRQRSDSTSIVAAIHILNRLELVGETLRHTLDRLAEVAPEWLKAQLTADWYDRYCKRLDEYRLPKDETKRMALAEQIGRDGWYILKAVYHQAASIQLHELEEVEILRQVWVQNYYQVDGQVRWRARGNLPPSATMISSPHDLDARYSSKRNVQSTGYNVHLTETCDHDHPCLITNVETTSATTFDGLVTQNIHCALAAQDLLPKEHIVDTSYVDSDLLMSETGVDLVGPVPPDTSWQAQAGQGFDISHFSIGWDTLTLTCPTGKTSYKTNPAHDRHGNEVLFFAFSSRDCTPCPQRAYCTRNASGGGRQVTIRPQAQHVALQAARQRQQTDEFKTLYASRAGVEGTISQAAHALGMRQARYRGMTKTHLQHIATAVALNLTRLFAWWREVPRAKTRLSHFAALAL